MHFITGNSFSSPISHGVLPGHLVHLVLAASGLPIHFFQSSSSPSFAAASLGLLQGVGGHLDQVGHQAGDALLTVVGILERGNRARGTRRVFPSVKRQRDLCEPGPIFD